MKSSIAVVAASCTLILSLGAHRPGIAADAAPAADSASAAKPAQASAQTQAAPTPAPPAPSSAPAATTGTAAPKPPPKFAGPKPTPPLPTLPPAVAKGNSGELIAALQKAVAPAGTWDKAAGLQFDVQMVRNGVSISAWRHLWDLKTKQYRLESFGEGVRPQVVIFDSSTRQGHGYTRYEIPLPASAGGGIETRWVRPPGALQEKLAVMGHDRYMRETRWLLLPLKLTDPGTVVEPGGEKTLDGKTYDVLNASFSRIGSLPPETYVLYLDKKTHLIARADVSLKVTGGPTKPVDPMAVEMSDKNHPPPVPEKTAPLEDGTWVWDSWTPVGGILVPDVIKRTDGAAEIVFRDVELLSKIPADAFVPPPLIEKTDPAAIPPAAAPAPPRTPVGVSPKPPAGAAPATESTETPKH